MLHHTTDLLCPSCEEKLSHAHPTLSDWYRVHVKPNFPDAHVSCSYRDAVDQEKAVADGKSRLHFPNSAHNKIPAQALDLFEQDQHGSASWKPQFFSDVNAMNEQLGVELLWGAHFRTLGDSDHFQLK